MPDLLNQTGFTTSDVVSKVESDDGGLHVEENELEEVEPVYSEKQMSEQQSTQDHELEAIDDTLKQSKLSRDQKIAFAKKLDKWDDKFKGLIQTQNEALDKTLADEAGSGKKK